MISQFTRPQKMEQNTSIIYFCDDFTFFTRLHEYHYIESENNNMEFRIDLLSAVNFVAGCTGILIATCMCLGITKRKSIIPL
jgi:hypothetical protein